MITLRSNKERQYDRQGKREVWRTFYPQDESEPLARGFGSVELLDEERLPPGADVPPREHHDGEIITYVQSGALEYEDSLRRSGVIQAGEFQRMRPVRDSGYCEKNASLTTWARVFRIRLSFWKAEGESGYDQKRFSAAELRGRLCLIASPDGRSGSLRIHQDALMYSAMLRRGQHVVHELSSGRSAWIHVVHGEVALGDLVLSTGDGAGVVADRAVSLTAREEVSILLLDVGELQPALLEDRGADQERGESSSPPGLGEPGAPGGAPERRTASGRTVPNLSGAVLFRMLWDALVDVLGPATTATVVSRAARRALPLSPELNEIVITRVDREFFCVVPRSFDRAGGPPEALRVLVDEIRLLLEQLTGQVVLRHLDQLPKLRGWATSAA